MSDTIKVPGISKPLPKVAVLGGLAVTGIGIVVYYRRHQATSTSAGTPGATDLAAGTNTADTSAYPWDGSYNNPSDPNSMDSASGQTYGNEGYSGGGVTSTTGGGPPFATNAAWSSYAIQQLTASGQGTAPVADALGLYLAGKLLDAAQEKVVYEAEAVAGQVPVDGPGGYPPKLRTSASGGGGSTHADNPVKGLHQTGSGHSDASVTWDKAAHATSYAVSLTGATSHRATTSATSHTFRDLRPGRYTAHVLARPAAPGARPAETSITVR